MGRQAAMGFAGALTRRLRGWVALSASGLVACGGAPIQRDVRITPSSATATAKRGSKEGPVNQFEMQASIERFTGIFVARVFDAVERVAESTDDFELRRAALTRASAYASAALDIASGPVPEVNVLDMVVFVELSKSTLERHWKPNVFGEVADPLLIAFQDLQGDIWQIAATIIEPEQQADLRALIASWLERHPDTIRVESVRFQVFSTRVGEVADELTHKARGLLGTVRQATQAADQALLLGERAMFLANRFPGMIRLQARLGTQELISDSLEHAKALAPALDKVPDPRPIVQDLTRLAEESRAAAEEARLTLQALEPILGQPAVFQDTLDSSNRLAETSLELVREMRALTPRDAGALATSVEAQIDRMARRFVAYLGLLGAAFAGLFWGGYFLFRRFSPPRQARSH